MNNLKPKTERLWHWIADVILFMGLLAILLIFWFATTLIFEQLEKLGIKITLDLFNLVFIIAISIAKITGAVYGRGTKRLNVYDAIVQIPDGIRASEVFFALRNHIRKMGWENYIKHDAIMQIPDGIAASQMFYALRNHIHEMGWDDYIKKD